MADGGGDAGAGGPPPLASVRDFWAALDLEALKRRLDGQGLQIAALQEDSLENRRRLAEATREFKRAAPAEVVSGVATLLKSYQEEARRARARVVCSLHSSNARTRAPSKQPAARRTLLASNQRQRVRCRRSHTRTAHPTLSPPHHRPQHPPPRAGGPADQARQALGGLLPGAVPQAV